ncbi:inner-membrane translocator [Streptomyces sp. NPDC048297]|uniref:inner-membrane translocator n=1 Tax=Streptomyces sp. NPDC048297 TaxID=3365531 RepID=UPI0037232FB8
MPERAGKQSSDGKDALTAGCLLVLVLVADTAAALLVLIVLAVRGLSRMDSDSVRTGAGTQTAAGTQTVAGAPAADWAPVLCFGALALAVCVTGVVLLRLGHRGIGAVQLVLCLVLASHALGTWP